jgi:hypothetical protein
MAQVSRTCQVALVLAANANPANANPANANRAAMQ